MGSVGQNGNNMLKIASMCDTKHEGIKESFSEIVINHKSQEEDTHAKLDNLMTNPNETSFDHLTMLLLFAA